MVLSLEWNWKAKKGEKGRFGSKFKVYNNEQKVELLLRPRYLYPNQHHLTPECHPPNLQKEKDTGFSSIIYSKTIIMLIEHAKEKGVVVQ